MLTDEKIILYPIFVNISESDVMASLGELWVMLINSNIEEVSDILPELVQNTNPEFIDLIKLAIDR